MSEKPAARSILSYSSAILFCRIATLAQGLVVIRLMEPGVLGMWLQLQLITIYGSLTHFGLLNAVNRQIPFHHGRHETERARQVERVVRGALLIVCSVGLIAICGMYLGGLTASPRGRGVLTLVFVTVVNLGIEFHLGLFRARHQFGRASVVSVVRALMIVGGLPLVYYWGFDGLIWRAALAALIALATGLALNGWDVQTEFDAKATLALLRIGLPIMTVGFGIVAFNSMDRTLITILLDETQMGLYAIGFALAMVLALFPTAVGQIYYPRMTELYAANGITSVLVRRCIDATALSSVVVGVAGFGAFFTIPWVVDQFFPRYAEGVPALKVALLSYFLLSMAAGPNYFLISTVQKRRHLLALTLGILAMIPCAFALSDYELVGIAWSLVVGAAVYVSGLWIIVARSFLNTRSAVA